MAVDRKMFLKISSLTALGAASGHALFAALSDISPADVQPPGKGLAADRWAMAIDIEKCLEGDVLKKAAQACHVVHNVPDFRNEDGEVDRKNEVKWIWVEPYERVFTSQHNKYLKGEMNETPVLTLCNHCSRPPCVRVCPTQATFRRKDGIVAMDMHRCIGCRFCIAACPYGSRSFNWMDPRKVWTDENGRVTLPNPDYPTRTKGVVEKCNFCTERLAEGKPPACVEAAGESGAMVFGDLKDEHSKVREVLESRYTIRRKPELGTEPAVYYVV